MPEGDGEEIEDRDVFALAYAGCPTWHVFDDSYCFAVEFGVYTSHDGDVRYCSVGVDYKSAQYASVCAVVACAFGVVAFLVYIVNHGVVASGKFRGYVDRVHFVDVGNGFGGQLSRSGSVCFLSALVRLFTPYRADGQ